MNQYAYIRVSTKEQNVDRQRLALTGFAVPEKNIYTDWQSGKDFDRPQYRKMLRKLKSGDLVLVKSIDRLGRNYKEILAQWQLITKEIGADIKVLDMELLDTRRRPDNLTGVLISDIVLQLLAYVAETERAFIRQRQAEGIAAAKAQGKKLGRKAAKLPENFQELCAACNNGAISTWEAARQAGLSHSTFYRHYRKEFEKERKNRPKKAAEDEKSENNCSE